MYRKLMSFRTSGSADYDNDFLKGLIKNKDPNVKVSFESFDKRRFTGTYIVETSHTDEKEIDKLFLRVKGIASHANTFNEFAYLQSKHKLYNR